MATTDSSSKATKEWKKMKVQELRDELSRRGLNTGGLRPSLIERLEKSSNPPGNAAAEACGPEVPEITPQVEEGPKFSSTNNGQLVAKDFVSGTIIDAEKLGDSNVSESVSIPAAPGTTVEKPSNDAKDNGVANVAGPVSDLEKKHRRAERFGLALQLSEEEKRQSRAARFGESPNGTPKSNLPAPGDMKTSEEERRKARAERFGLSPRSSADDEAKKKARLARFGMDVKSDFLEDDKRKARAARFSSAVNGNASEVNEKLKPELAGAVALT